MKSPARSSFLSVAILAFVAVLASQVPVLAGNTWDGGGADNNWGTAANWNPDGAPGYGTISFSGTNRISNVNNSITAMNQVNWNGTAAWVMTGSTTLSLFDNGGTQAKLESLGTGGVTINAPITFAANNGSPPNPFGEINAVSSNISFTGSTLTVNGSSVNGIKLFGGAGKDVSFGNTVSASGKWFAFTNTNGSSVTVASGGTVTTGDFYVMNGGTLNLSGGSLTTSAVRLGGDFGTTGNQNQTFGGTLALTPATGGVSFSSTINSVSGNSSGALLIDSKNSSGTNTLGGGIFLDSGLKFQQASGGTLALSGGIDVKGNIATFQGAGDFNVSSVVSNSTGSGRVTQNGTGLLRFGAANTYSNETDINAGTIRVDVAPSGTGILSTYYVGNGAATGTAANLLLGGGAGGTSGGITLGNPVSANLGSGGNRVIGGSNTTGTNTFSGTVTLNDSNATLRAATGGTVSFNTISASALQTVAIGGGGNDGTVQFNGVSDNVNVAATVNSGTLVLAKTSYGAVHSVGGTLAVNSGATAKLGGTGGDQIFNSGSITVNSGGTFDANDRTETVTNVSIAGNGVGSAGALVNSGTSSSSVTATGTTTLAADSSIGVTNVGGTLALSGNISGSFGLTKVGAGTLTLIGTNSHTTTTVSAGTLQIGSNGTTGSLGTGAVTNDGTLAFNRSNSLTVANDISGTGNVTQSGSGTTILTGTNSYGTTTISSGTLQVGNGGSTGTLGTGSVTNNGSLIFNRAAGAPNNFVLTNAIGGTGTLTQNGGNFITISSANTYTGATTINSGRLRIEANEALGTGAAGTTVNSGGALLLAGVNYSTAEALTINGTGVGGSGALANVSGNSTYAGQVTVASNATIKVVGELTLSGGVVKNGTTLTVAGPGTVWVNGAGISGAAANSDLIVDGATLVVNAASNYNGPSTVQNFGTLVANASITTTNVSVDSSSTLAGTSTINAGTGLITINGSLVVGDPTVGSPTASMLDIKTSGAGSTSFGSTSFLYIDLFSNVGDNTGVAGASDLLRLFGTVSVDAATQLFVTDATGSMAFNAGDKWKFADISSATVTGGFSNANIIAPALSGSKEWQFSSNGSSWFLSVVAVPEPSRALLLLVGVGVIGYRRRRK